MMFLASLGRLTLGPPWLGRNDKAWEGSIMTILNTPAPSLKKSFNVVAEPFLLQEGQPFASVLDAPSIQQAFIEQDAIFGQHDNCQMNVGRQVITQYVQPGSRKRFRIAGALDVVPAH